MLEIKSNSLKIVFNNIEYNFTPTKPKNKSDIAFDVRARLVDSKSNEHTLLTIIQPNEIKKIPLGFSLIMPKEVKMVTESGLMHFENYISDIIDARLQNSFAKEPQATDYLEEDDFITLFPSSQLLGRSGMFFKSSITAFNGQIDNAYDDELVIALQNIGDIPQTIHFGERIGQIEIKLVPDISIKPFYKNSAEDLNGNSRGGFGSSGRH